MTVKFIKINIEKNIKEWNSFFKEQDSEDISLAANPSFANIFEDLFNIIPEYYFVYYKNSFIGAIPGFRGRNKFYSVPVLSSAGLYLKKYKENKNQFYLDFIDQIGSKFEIRDFLKITDHCYSDKVTCYLDLPESDDVLWNNFKSKLRSQIRKGYKNGLKCVTGGIELLSEFYSIYSRNMHRLGTPVPSINYFKKYLSEYKFGIARIFLVDYNQEIIAASITLSYNKFFEVMWASTTRKFNRLNTNMVIYWEMMKFAINQDMKIFSFGRSTINSTNLKFKEQWDVRKIPLFFNYDKPKKNIRNIKWAQKIWKRLPYKIAILLGPIVRKKIIN